MENWRLLSHWCFPLHLSPWLGTGFGCITFGLVYLSAEDIERRGFDNDDWAVLRCEALIKRLKGNVETENRLSVELAMPLCSRRACHPYPASMKVETNALPFFDGY